MKSPHARLLRLLLPCAALCGMVLFLQGPVAHRATPFVPGYPKADLAPLLAQPVLSPQDYGLLFRQTGLGRSAVDELLAAGPSGAARILDIQTAFFAPVRVACEPIFGLMVKEDRLETAEGAGAWAPPIGGLRLGDILLTYSTHALGWRHGHAGLVVRTEGGGSTLEAVMVGTDSAVVDAGHWREYSNFMVLRLREMTPALGKELADFALEHLNGVPYRLTSGLLGRPEPEDGAFGVHCSYLVWYAFRHFGYDLDSDGGRLVTVNDLARSPLLEAVRIYGLDPGEWSHLL